MSRRLLHMLTLLVAVAIALVLSGCAEGSQSPVELTSGDSGSTQQLAPGQKMVLSLDANPTTGYAWSIDGSLPSQLKQVGEAKYSSNSSAVGAGGSEIWTFEAQGAGTGTLRLKYWRSFEPTATPAASYAVQVAVE